MNMLLKGYWKLLVLDYFVVNILKTAKVKVLMTDIWLNNNKNEHNIEKAAPPTSSWTPSFNTHISKKNIPFSLFH